MGNVNELMTELADAVRLKSGVSGEMTIKQMVIAMAGITVADDIGFTCGTVKATATGSAKVIPHGLGHVPGAVLFVKVGSAESSLSSSSTTTYYDALMSIVYGEDAGHTYCYGTLRRTSSSSSTTTYKYWTNSTTTPSTMFCTGQTTSSYYITNINETSFTTPKGLFSGDTYLWIAFRAPLK